MSTLFLAWLHELASADHGSREPAALPSSWSQAIEKSSALRRVLLRRSARVYLPDLPEAEGSLLEAGGPQTGEGDGVALVELETALLHLGFALDVGLRAALAALPGSQVEQAGRWIVATLAEELGAHRPHIPQFRGFPKTTPEDTLELWLLRVCTLLFQKPQQPCLLCATVGAVHAVSPCGHLVCRTCWDGADYSGCPICHRRINADDPFLKPAPPRKPLPGPQPGTLRLLRHGSDLSAATGDLFAQLAGRLAPLSPADVDDLRVLLAADGFACLARLPEKVPVKETMAIIFGSLLGWKAHVEGTLAQAGGHLRTATDVLRVVMVLADQKLTERPKRIPSLSRPLRRGLLAALDRLPAHLLIEDIHRYPHRWKRVARSLHPFEHHARHPTAALAFAVLRGTDVSGEGALASSLRRSAEGVVERRGDRLIFRSWGSRVEAALASGAVSAALRLLKQRPGELLRRFDRLLCVAQKGDPSLIPAISQAVIAAAPRGATPMLLTLTAHLGTRQAPLERRVFFPRGSLAKTFSVPDRRASLPASTVGPVRAGVLAELLRRAGEQSSFDAALLDARLCELTTPYQEASAARALVALPRGSRLPLPDGDRMRLFLHWVQPEGRRTDLDLSVALYDDEWGFKDRCSYSKLRFSKTAAVHSGDLTSAPAPKGASEFIDLDLPAIRRAGIRHLVFIIYSFNNIPFDELPVAFAGYMERSGDAGEIFEPRTVAQRFDLGGASRVAVPLVIDLKTRRMRWIDLKLTSSAGVQAVSTTAGSVAQLCRDVSAYFDAGSRPSLWTLACLHAAARCPVVWVRDAKGAGAYVREDDSVEAFFARIESRSEPDWRSPMPKTGPRPLLAALLRDDAEIADGSEVYALHWERLSEDAVTRIRASDLMTF